MSAQFVKLTPVGRQTLFQTVERKLQQRLQRRIGILKEPEGHWLTGLSDLTEADDTRPETLADYLVSIVDGGTATQFVQASLRTRTQWRVLALYSQANAYRWQHGNWPAKLDAVDPLSGEPFVYEVHEDGTIKIASKGTKEIGEIGLLYRTPKPVEQTKP